MYYLCIAYTVQADMAQLVERRLPKPNVAGSSPVYRSIHDKHDKLLSS